MPGHPISESELKKVEADINLLESLIKENDIIFLLTDSRESRWLPILLATKYNKVIIL